MSASISIQPGSRFGSWTVIAAAPRTDKRTMYLCRCDCGTKRPVESKHLRQGNSTRCRGCQVAEKNAIHGFARRDEMHPLYATTNCRWATTLEQNLNRKSVLMVEVDGVTRSAEEWGRLTGKSGQTVKRRIVAGVDPSTAVRARGGVEHDKVTGRFTSAVTG